MPDPRPLRSQIPRISASVPVPVQASASAPASLAPLLRVQLGITTPPRADPAGPRRLHHRLEDSSSATLSSVFAFVVAFVVYLLVGVGCTLGSAHVPPKRSLEHANDATCLIAFRRAHYSEARLFIGTPLRELRLLIRLDATLACGNTAGRSNGSDHPGLTIFNPDVLHSRSISCDADDLCTDVAIAERWHQDLDRINQMRPFRFAYGQDNLLGNEAVRLGLDGELVLCRGVRYALSARQLCASVGAGAGAGAGAVILDANARSSCLSDREGAAWALMADVSEPPGPSGPAPVTRLRTTACALRAAGPEWANVPAAHAACDDCSAPIDLWPSESSIHSSWTTFSTERMYDLLGADPDHGVAALRAAVESGGPCAAAQPALHAARAAFETSCRNLLYSGSACGRRPSVTPLRSARHRIEIDALADGRACARLWHDSTLESVPQNEQGGSSSDVWHAWVRLVLMVLAAAIMWVRREDASHHVDHIFARCIQIAVEGSSRHVVDFDAQTTTLGLLATLARLSLVFSRFGLMRVDGHTRVAVSECVAGVLSLIHWSLLYGGRVVPAFQRIKTEGLRPALGGSSAVVDITCATMVAFSAPPVRGDSQTFDLIARLLTAVLLCVVCLGRCLLSAACSGSILRRRGRVVGTIGVPWPRLSGLACIFWTLQGASIAVLLADLFAAPIAHDWMRTSTGDARLATLALFLSASIITGPRLTANASLIVTLDPFADERGQ